ncbi:uncharacterized protein LOC122055960 isoform X1 [Zingiber officinale]|uniref:uncharacterized protein LOC122055960 isoform X1 n=1 Tax=Zingiber officinale TaxID=94328 RepID=UPI001C4D8A7C|nr:uncharacterized protein LOC122055960 isoform X1 [Zingiber officinale]
MKTTRGKGSRHLVTEETRKAKPKAGTSLSRAAVSVSSHLSSRRHFPFPSSSIGQSMPSLRRHPPRSSLPQRHHLRPRPRRSPAGSSSPLQMVPDLRPRPRRVHPLQCALALRQSQRAGPGKADPSSRLQEESTHGRRRHQLAHQSLLQVRQHRRRGEGVRRSCMLCTGVILIWAHDVLLNTEKYHTKQFSVEIIFSGNLLECVWTVYLHDLFLDITQFMFFLFL